MTMSDSTPPKDPFDRLFDEIAGLGDKLDATQKQNAERFQKVESRVEKLETTVGAHTHQIGNINEALTRCSSAAAHAADIALTAQRRAGETLDETTKIVRSALQIHNASIAAAVASTVKNALEPLTKKVVELEKNDEEVLRVVRETASKVSSAISNRWLRALIVVAVAVGAMGGGYLAGREQARSVPSLIK